jgi:DNA-binding beta-propeller fold protein YncE
MNERVRWSDSPAGALCALAILGLTGGCAASAAAGSGTDPSPAARYEAWVASEAVDEISLIRFEGGEASVVTQRAVGSIPVELEGPHGIAVSPDGRYVYVTLAHGLPNGSLLKIDTRTNQTAGRTLLGLFPATVSITPDGEYGFVSNFNLHGDHVPSTISMVHLPSMVEVARTETCVMPHGSRVNSQGTRHYSVCMMNELLVEIDAATGAMLRAFSVKRGEEGPVSHSSHEMTTDSAAAAEIGCSPTWAEPSADGTRVFVTCNRAREVLEIDVGRWEVLRRFETGENPYNLAVTPDGRVLLVSLRNRDDAALELFDLATGRMIGRVPASTTLAHGIGVTTDSRYAFLTSEGVGSEPGRVDVIDLASARRVASVTVGQQPTGVAVVPNQVR